MGTFTKSFGSAGGYVAGSRQLVAYLRRHSPAHLYAASMAPGAAQQVRGGDAFWWLNECGVKWFFMTL